MTPQQDALRAIFVFLQMQGFSPMWDGGLDKFTVQSKESKRLSSNCDTFRVSFLDGELCMIRSRLSADLGSRGSGGLKLDFGAQFFDLADPGCFDQIVDVLRGKRLSING